MNVIGSTHLPLALGTASDSTFGMAVEHHYYETPDETEISQ